MLCQASRGDALMDREYTACVAQLAFLAYSDPEKPGRCWATGPAGR